MDSDKRCGFNNLSRESHIHYAALLITSTLVSPVRITVVIGSPMRTQQCKLLWSVSNTYSLSTVPDEVIMMVALVCPHSEPRLSIALTTALPFTTLPNTTCRPSNHDVLAVVMKDWERFVSLPPLAMESRNGSVCFNSKFSSANFGP